MPSAREASAPAVFGVPGVELLTSTGESLPLTGAALDVVAKGGIARAVLTHTFVNDHDEPLQVTYKMPLPADGAVSGYAFELGDRTVTGDVRPKAQARADFEAALAQGKTAAILDQEKADIFTQEIGNVPPRTTVVARITVDMRLAWLPEGEWELRFPTVIGPRYVGASDTPETVRAVTIGVVPSGIVARLSLALSVKDDLTQGSSVSSPTHALSPIGDGRVELSAREGTRLDRDLVVRWRVARPEVGVSLSLGRKGERTFGLLTVVPPSIDAKKEPTPRDLCILLDTSGSMGGTPLTHAKGILRGLIGSLESRDRLELIEFSSSPRAYSRAPVSATMDEKRRAIAWMEKLEAGGATEMRTAVLSALRPLRDDAQRQVVLITDGYIGGEEEILQVLAEALPKGCRMHMVGVGAAPNRSLATAIARAGRGAEILTAEGEDLERATKRLVDKTRAPMLTEVAVSGPAIMLRAPESVPDVYAASPLLVALELEKAGGEITVSGNTTAGTWTRTVRVPLASAVSEEGAIPALFARERVADLDVRWAMGRNAAELDREIERLGVDFQIATRMTSFVAIDDRKSVDPNAPYRKVSVPQELPHGTSFQSFGLTAPTAMPMSMAMPAPAMAYGMPMGGASGGGAPPAPQSMAFTPPASLSPLRESAASDDDEARTVVAGRMEKKAEAPSAQIAPAPAPMASGAAAPGGAPLGAPQEGRPSMGAVFGAPQRTATPTKGFRSRMLALLLVALFVLVLVALAVYLFLRFVH
jgi:Ca-activated chloride channel family protein